MRSSPAAFSRMSMSDGHAPIAPLVEGERTHDGVRDSHLVERARKALEGYLYVGLAHEEPPGLGDARPESVFVLGEEGIGHLCRQDTSNGICLDSGTSHCYILVSMLAEPTTYDLNELSDRAGVTPRTVRYYIQQGLLPAPDAQGPSTRYGQGHLDRLLLIRQLQREHQPLAEIRAQLEGLRDEDVSRVLSTSRPSKRPSSAVDYVRSVLGSPGPPRAAGRWRPPPMPSPSPPVKSQWERISLAPDVELHVRRPLTREINRRVEKLLDLARHILQEEE